MTIKLIYVIEQKDDGVLVSSKTDGSEQDSSMIELMAAATLKMEFGKVLDKIQEEQ